MLNFKKLVYLFVIYGCSLANAGSYDDFFTAIIRNDESTITQLLNRGFDVNTRNPNGDHGLLLAIQRGSERAIDALMKAPKLEVESRNKLDESPLMLACLQGNLALAQQLIAKDADVNKPGWTPLHYASTHGHLAVMNLLLENHAYIDAASPNGTTPLMMAALYGTPSAVKLLLEAGADPMLKTTQGLTAIDFANRDNRRDSADIIAAFVRGRQPQGAW
jgi:ankyrin repeat protein